MSIHTLRSFWYDTFAGLCALFIGIGLCRFAYTAIMPALIQQNWLNPSAAGYLAASNLLGYLITVALIKKMLHFCSIQHLIKASLLLAIVSLALCAIEGGFIWLSLWRFISGVSGAVLIVLTPAATLKNVPNHYKGRAAGILFTGIGLGIIASGLIFPAFVNHSIAITWLIAAGLASILSLLAWPAFNTINPPTVLASNAIQATVVSKQNQQILNLLTLAYLLYGIGMVPHTLYLVTYLQDTYGISLSASGLFWSLFGLGATLGPICSGLLADKIGTYKSLAVNFALATLALFITLFTPALILCLFTTFIMGMLFPAIPSLLSARILELVGVKNHPLFWGRSALYCAISQALAAYLMAYFLQSHDAYLRCFLIADGAFLLGLIAIIYSGVGPLIRE